jgi:predicted TIM-barrel fold metal-dependent hydrolase
MIGRWPMDDLAFHDLDGLIGRMDRLGIERAIVGHTWAWHYDPVTGNDALMRELAVAPPPVRARLLPCWAVVPCATGEQGSPDELAAAMAAQGVRAARLFPRDHNYSLSSPDMMPVLAMLAAHRIVTLIDLDQTGWEELDRVASEYPDLPLVACRIGYRGLRRFAGVLERRPNIAIDLSYFGLHEGVEWIVDRFGPGRLLFGTGAPLVDGGGPVSRLMLARIDQDAREAIGRGTLANLLAGQPGQGLPWDDATTTAPDDASPTSQLRRGEPIHGWDIIDAHAHVGPWYNFHMPRPDAATMLAVMDRCGARLAVVSSMIGIGPDAAAGNAEMVALVRAHPDRFAGYAVFNPHHPGSAADVASALDLPGVVGIKIHPDTHAYQVGEPDYAPAFELATRRAVPILTHTFADSPFCDPAMFDAVAARWPEARVILGHAGATDAGHRASIAVAQNHPNLYLELCGSFTTGLWIRRLVEAVGAERVIFGTDFPFIDFRYTLGRVVFAGLSEADTALILGGNARRLLNLPPPPPKEAQ